MGESMIDLRLAASMLRDLSYYLDQGDYDGVLVFKEGYDTYAVFKGIRISLDEVDESVLQQLGFEKSLELLYRLARAAIRRHGRNVEGWLFLDEGASSDSWIFFARPSGRVIYAMVYDQAVNDRVFYRITRKGIEEVSVEKLKRLFGVEVYKLFPDIFAVTDIEPESIFLDEPIVIELTLDMPNLLRKVVRRYVETLRKRPYIVRDWLLGTRVFVPVDNAVYRELRGLCLVLPWSALICCEKLGYGYIYVSPEYIAKVFPAVFEELKRVARIEVSVVDVVKKLRGVRIEEPVSLAKLSEMLGIDVKQMKRFLPYLASTSRIYVFDRRALYVLPAQ